MLGFLRQTDDAPPRLGIEIRTFSAPGGHRKLRNLNITWTALSPRGPVRDFAESWWARLEKLSRGRLLGRFFAASRERLRSREPPGPASPGQSGRMPGAIEPVDAAVHPEPSDNRPFTVHIGTSGVNVRSFLSDRALTQPCPTCRAARPLRPHVDTNATTTANRIHDAFGFGACPLASPTDSRRVCGS